MSLGDFLASSTRSGIAVEGCGVRISSTTRSRVISVRVGAGKKFETIGRIAPDRPYEYLPELAVKRKRVGEPH